VGVIYGILWLALIPEDSLSLPLQVLRDWYPITTILVFYLEIPPLATMVLQRYLDDRVMEFEGRLFNGQPSMYLSERLSSKWLSELLHLCYFSYYPMVFGLAGILYFQGRYETFHEVVFGEILTFNLCLGWYIVMPVLGPYYVFEKIRGPMAEGPFFRLVHLTLATGASKGTAFPSSHCAIGVIVVLYAARYDPVAFAIMCPFGVGLVIATVYARMHYAVDAILGTVVAIVIFGAAPYLYRLLL
jgi:membrane-associated phospholipid phosphatase